MLGDQMSALGAQMAALDAQRAALGAQMAALGAQMAAQDAQNKKRKKINGNVSLKARLRELKKSRKKYLLLCTVWPEAENH